MFEKKNIPKKTSLGILRELNRSGVDPFLKISENRRKQFIKEIKEGKFEK